VSELFSSAEFSPSTPIPISIPNLYCRVYCHYFLMSKLAILASTEGQEDVNYENGAFRYLSINKGVRKMFFISNLGLYGKCFPRKTLGRSGRERPLRRVTEGANVLVKPKNCFQRIVCSSCTSTKPGVFCHVEVKGEAWPSNALTFHRAPSIC